MEFDEFVQCLDNITEPDENVRSPSSNSIIEMRANDPVLFFNLTFQVFDDENSSISRVIKCLSAIKDMLISTEAFPLREIVKNWFSDFMSDIRPSLKSLIRDLTHNEEYSIRTLSSSMFALIFQIELQKLKEDDYWKEVFSNFVDEFISEEGIEHCKHGIMSFLHELMILQSFSRMKKKSYVGEEFHRFLLQIIDNLKEPESNPKNIFDYSILCLSDLVNYYIEIFYGEQEVLSLLEAYEYALPMTESQQYQLLFEAMYTITTHFYDHAEFFMETIFDYSTKGIDCPNDDLVCISIEFWIQLCRNEKKLGEESKKITQNAIKPLIELLLNVISKNNRETLIQAINLIRCFSDVYTIDTINITYQIIKSLIDNDEDIVGVFISLALIRGVCSKRSEDFNRFEEFFDRISFLINLGIMNETETAEEDVDDTIPYAAIWAANSIISSCKIISNNDQTFDFILNLLQNPNLNPSLIYSMFRLADTLFDSSSIDFVKKHFMDFFDTLFSFIDQNAMIRDKDDLDAVFAALSKLVLKVPVKFQKLSNSYGEVYEKFYNYTNSSETSQDDFFDLKLGNIIQLIKNFIHQLSDDFEVFTNDLVESLILCSGVYRDLFYDDILTVFSSLCIFLKDKFFEHSETVINLIETGFDSQLPQIISTSIILLCDLAQYVDTERIQLIDKVFELLDKLPPYDVSAFLPSFIKSFSRLYLNLKYNQNNFKNGDFIFPPELIEQFYCIVDERLNNHQLSIDCYTNSRDFDEYYAARVYEACFYAYAAYFHNQEKTPQNFEKAKKLIDKKVLVCLKTGAYDCDTAFALNILVKELFEIYKNEIIMTLNSKCVTRILTEAKNNSDQKQYIEEIESTLTKIKS